MMEYLHKNGRRPHRHPVEGIGICTLWVRASWVVVLVSAPMVKVSLEYKNITCRELNNVIFFGIDSYVVST